MPRQKKLDTKKKDDSSTISELPLTPPSLHKPLNLPENYAQFPQEKTSLVSSTGIVAFDKLLGGGFPKGAVILVAGSSGSGKTIFSFQWLFEGIKHNENGLYITLTEPLFKSLKNLEILNFYNKTAIEQERLKIVDIREIYEKQGFNQQRIIDYIEEQVKLINAKRLCIDSITAIAYNLDDKAQIRKFIFELGKVLATLGCTTILTSEVATQDKYSIYEVEEFISDAILRFDQIQAGDDMQRTLKIIKVRGTRYEAEDLHFRITDDGITVFPKLKVPLKYASTTERISTGIPMLDQMMCGGIFKGSSMLVVGSTGTGKSLLSMQFILDGLKKGEPCLYAGFEESKEQLIRNAETFGWDITQYEKSGLLILHCVYPSEKFLEEHLENIRQIVESHNIKRCVVDSLSSIANFFPPDSFVGFAKRLNGYLKIKDVTTFFTAATTSLIGATTLSEGNLSTMTDNIIMLRYVEMQGELRLVMNIIKMRGSDHSKELVKYDIKKKGIVIGQSLAGYEGVMTGVTRKVSETTEEKLESEFKHFIGPMGSSIFSEIKNKGLTKTTIFEYIDELAKQRILKEEDSKIFKQGINEILGPSMDDAYFNRNSVNAKEQTSNPVDAECNTALQGTQVEEITKNEEKTNPNTEKKSLWKRIFGLS